MLLRCFFIILVTFGYSEWRTITEDDASSAEKRAFLQKLHDEKPVYSNYYEAWKDITNFTAVVYEPQRIVTRENKAPLFVRTYRIAGDDYSGLGSPFVCEQNLCPIVFELLTHNENTGESHEYRNTDILGTLPEWIVLELLSERSGILHFMDRKEKIRVRKTEQGLHIDLYPVFHSSAPNQAILKATPNQANVHDGIASSTITTRQENGLTITVADGTAPFAGERNEATPVFITSTYYPTYYAPQTSFDCLKTIKESEQAICEKANLADLDMRIAAYYNEILSFYPPIQIKQTAWLRERDRCGVDEECLKNIMQKRVDELSELLVTLISQR